MKTVILFLATFLAAGCSQTTGCQPDSLRVVLRSENYLRVQWCSRDGKSYEPAVFIKIEND